ncbi:hypothetical protein [Novosphingobium sp. Gsoil 351]|uniref:hypothetical protein n=1 Tax=Novosphingobium sp. Gsoil 351 TaxID=2675225 RepID=UPI0012B465AE|nr:hypothetical protein [Novosphingobium sp. Gsoil 351]QGN54234.1 hypothetical protein GKE62_06400 [Novosphingobium sp. Gsoil 351]
MSSEEFAHTRFSFERRPTPVPGDLRITWRVSLILLMLSASRSSRASLAKLHIVNDAIRSNQIARLRDATDADAKILPWNLRVEPAFARAIDFVVGERLAEWTRTGGRASLQLTSRGLSAAKQIEKVDDALERERAIVFEHAKKLTEIRVSALLGERQAA